MSDFKNQDNEIIEKLRRGLEQSDPMPSTVSEFAGALFTWRDIDAQLAELSFDSVSEDTPTGVRSTATARMISFAVTGWTIDVEHNPTTGILMGSVSPESRATIELHTSGARFTVASDDMGRFEFEGVEQGLISLVVHFEDGETIKTTWISL